MELKNGCKGCIYSRKYSGNNGYFCKGFGRKDNIEVLAQVKDRTKSIWPFNIIKQEHIKSCNGYIEENK